MKKHLLALSAAAVLLAPNAVGAEGFSINEWSAEGFAMGGARMFAENDAANMAYNPASLTKIKGEVAKISATYISPHGKYKTYDATGTGFGDETGHNRVHPAWAPGMYYAKQLNENEYIGFGSYARFGNSCQFVPGSMPGYNNTSSKVNGMSIGMNYAKKLDSKWSASLGAEVNYAWLQIDKTVPDGAKTFVPGVGIVDVTGKMQTEGESYALGWNAAVNYAFDDKNEMGVVYRSAVNHSMEANVRAEGAFANKLGNPTDAYGCVTLPESVMIGYGHKFNDKTRVELNGTWTRWSRFNALDMTFSGSHGSHVHEDPKNWKDGWRYAIGVEHKLSDKYSLLGGIAYDESGIPDYEFDKDETLGADFMVPTGTRTTFTIGGQYHDEKQTVALTIGYMKVGDLSIEGDGGPEADTFYTHAKMYDSYTKLVSISYQYHF